MKFQLLSEGDELNLRHFKSLLLKKRNRLYPPLQPVQTSSTKGDYNERLKEKLYLRVRRLCHFASPGVLASGTLIRSQVL